MTAEQGRSLEQAERSLIASPFWSTALQRALAWIVALLAVAMVGFMLATVLAPRLTVALQPNSMEPDGEHAFMQGLSLKAPWPYVVPSHPDDRLSSGETTLLQDGALIGALEPSHAEIRRLGEGRYDLWQGTLWFSTTGPDPRDAAHTFRFSVLTRLAPTYAAARLWCAVALLVLLAIQTTLAAIPYVMIGFVRPLAVVKGWGHHSSFLRRVAASFGIAVVLAVTALWRRRWRFRLPFFICTSGVLAGLATLAARQPVRILVQPDSYGYIEPGLRLADGQSLAGASIRDLGYPILTFLAVRLGSITDLVPIQFGMILTALACMLFVLSIFFASLLRQEGFQAGRVPLLLTVGLSVVGVLYVLLLFSHDGFVINIYSFMAEAPHALPMAASLLALVSGWASPNRRRRIVLFALSTDAAFVSTVVKPSSLLTVVFCAACLLGACVMHRRHLRSASVIATLVLSVVLIGSLRQIDSWATPHDADFGAKVLFCNHLDVVDGHIAPTTPERARIKEMIARVFSLGPHGWPEQGYDGDQCTFSQDFTDAIIAAARAESTSTREWQMHEFVASVLAHPLRYARHSGRQLLHFLRYPLDEFDQRAESHVTDADWGHLQTYGVMRQIPRDRFDAVVPNWFGDLAPELSHALKDGLKLMASTFAIVAGASTLLAFWRVFRVYREDTLRSEAILLAVFGFTMALPLTVALSHTFDVGRYSVDILPFTGLLWCMGIVYLLRGFVGLAIAIVKPRSFFGPPRNSPGAEG